jgi:hypothetical protein
MDSVDAVLAGPGMVGAVGAAVVDDQRLHHPSRVMQVIIS